MSEKIFVVTGKHPHTKNTNLVTPYGNVNFDENGVAEVNEDIQIFLNNNPQYEITEKKAQKKSTSSNGKKNGNGKSNGKKKDSKKEDDPEIADASTDDEEDNAPGDVD